MQKPMKYSTAHFLTGLQSAWTFYPPWVASQSAASPGWEGERGLSVALLTLYIIMRRNKELGTKQQKTIQGIEINTDWGQRKYQQK